MNGASTMNQRDLADALRWVVEELGALWRLRGVEDTDTLVHRNPDSDMPYAGMFEEPVVREGVLPAVRIQ
jgi:hypothetical protein